MWRTREPGREPVVLHIDDPSSSRWWCGCHRLAETPCIAVHSDGSAPAPVQAARPGWIWLCGCDRSARWPACDGSHRFAASPEPPAAHARRER